MLLILMLLISMFVILFVTYLNVIYLYVRPTYFNVTYLNVTCLNVTLMLGGLLRMQYNKIHEMLPVVFDCLSFFGLIQLSNQISFVLLAFNFRCLDALQYWIS